MPVDIIFAAIDEARHGRLSCRQRASARIADVATALIGAGPSAGDHRHSPGEKIHEIMVSEEKAYGRSGGAVGT